MGIFMESLTLLSVIAAVGYMVMAMMVIAVVVAVTMVLSIMLAVVYHI